MRKVDKKTWDETQEYTEFKRLAPGGYMCVILNVTDYPQKEYLKIEYDIVKGDEKKYFSHQYESDNRKDKKWPNAGTIYRSYKDNALSMFKGFITAITESNKNFNWDWDEQVLKNKYFGAIIGEEEYLNQKGQKRVRNYVVSVRSIPTIESGDFDIPELKKLDETKTTTNNSNAVIDPFEATDNTDGDSVPPFETSNEPDPFENF